MKSTRPTVRYAGTSSGSSSGGIVRMSRDLEQERYALAERKGRPGLLRRIDAILATMEETGELAMLDEAWGLYGAAPLQLGFVARPD